MLPFISSAFLSIAVADCNKKSLSSMVFHDATTLRVRGRAFNATGPEATAYPFERLPASSKGVVRDAVYGLSEQPAGLFVQFESDASCIFVNYTLVSASTSMWHFASTGEAGMDLYAWDDGNATWRWTGTAAPSYPVTTKKVAAAACSSADKCKLRSYRLHLPTYARVRDVQIGINREANVLRSDSTHIDASAKPIVWYGTSILQGAVASRPGQINTHIVSRALSREIYNFGFSGNGLMELSVARYLAPIPASLIIIDCNPNMVASLITNRTKPLVAYLRTHGHATTPIVLSEGTPYGADWTYTAAAASGNAPKNVALKAEYDALIAAGDTHLYYAKSVDIFADDLGLAKVSGVWVDPTVGGTHPTDLGMRKQAAFWATKIPAVLLEDQEKKEVVTTEASSSRAPPPTPVELAAEAVVSARHASSSAPPMTAEQQRAADVEANAADVVFAMRAAVAGAEPVDAKSWVLGRPFPGAARNHSYDRLPMKYSATLRPDVFALGRMSTGSYLRFTTNGSVQLSWTLRPACAEKWFAGCHLYHMPDSGTNAFDTYIWDPRGEDGGVWRHSPNSALHYAESGTTTIYIPDVLKKSGTSFTFLVYLPLRNAPETITLLSADAGAALCGGPKANCANDLAPDFMQPPIVWYGTSIQQGGVAARAGNTYDAVISRALKREVWNLGFANNGVLDMSVATMIGDIDAASVIVLDCLPNMNAAEVTNRTVQFVEMIRAQPQHATTPIILAEGTPTPNEWLNSSSTGVWKNAKNAALFAEYTKLVAKGVAGLHYVDANELFIYGGSRSLTPGVEGKDVNPTVCGIHSSDLGQYEIASFYVGMLPAILASSH